MRCPDCAKMVSYGEPELEVTNEEVDEEGSVSVSVSLTLPCADCGQGLKSFDFELDDVVDHDCPKKEEGEGEAGFELDLDEPQSTEDYRPKTDPKTGKPVPIRYQKHYYGVEITGTVTCKKCQEQFPVSMSDDAQASSFDELV